MYTIKDARTYGVPYAYEGFGDLISTLAAVAVSAAQIGATLYTTNLQQKMATDAMREERRRYNDEVARQKQIADNMASAINNSTSGTMQDGGASGTEKPAGSIVIGGVAVDSSKIMLYGGLGVGALILIMMLRR